MISVQPQGAGKHIKAFAGETLSAIHGLSLFCSLVVVPKGVLVQNVQAFLLLAAITRMLLCEESAVLQVDLLEQMVLEHFKLCLLLYPGMHKIKPHLLFHIIDSIRYWGVSPNCFVCERWHQIPKLISGYAKNHRARTCLVSRAVIHMLSRFADSQVSFDCSDALVGSRPVINKSNRGVTDEWPWNAHCLASRKLSTGKGTISAGSIVRIASYGGGWQIGKVVLFFETDVDSSREKFVYYCIYVRAAVMTWAPSGETSFCPTSCIIGTELARESVSGLLHMPI